MMKQIIRRGQKRSGQSLIEYALIVALIAVVAIAILSGIGTSIKTKLGEVNASLQ